MDASRQKVDPADGNSGAPRKVRLAGYLSPRAIIQVFLTFLAFATGIAAFIFILVFNKIFVSDLMENRDGSLSSKIHPCIRKVYDASQNGPDKDCSIEDTCWSYCCPTPPYDCMVSPIVGLMCINGQVQCGGGDEDKREWCRDYMDLPGTCATAVCQKRQLVEQATEPALFLSGAGAALDVIDVVIYFASPDSVAFKACFNLFSSLVKWMAFGVLLGAGAQEFMTDLNLKGCYNEDGRDAVLFAGQMLIAFVVIEVVSALVSLILAPISAYYGGKVIGVPYVKTTESA